MESEIKNQDGILSIHEVFYLESILYAAERANAAFERFDNETNQRLAVANVQEALTHVGELSRIFWPSRDNGVSILRAEKLKKAFELNEESELKNRNLRDALEHFDERLDLYLENFPVGLIVTEPTVRSLDSIEIPVHIFRMVDPNKSTFVMLDQKYEFGTLREITKLTQEKARSLLDNGGRLN